MNWGAFAKVGLTIAKVMVPQIATVEAAVVGIKRGPDKKAAVLDTLRSSIELAEVLSGKEIVDQQLLLDGLGEINDGFVKVMKSLRTPAAEAPQP